MPGCSLYVNVNLASLPFTPTGSEHTLQLPMGNDPSFVGQHFYFQSFAIALGLTPLNLISSNGMDWRVDAR